MTSFYCEQVFLSSGWQTQVRITVDQHGLITAIDYPVNADSSDIVISDPVVPALPNCHSHAFQRAFAGLSERKGHTEDSFWTWRQLMYQFLARLSPEDCHIIAKQLYVEMLKAGYNAVGEFHYLHHGVNGSHYEHVTEMAEQVIAAATDVGIKMTMLPVFYQYAGFGQQPASELQQRFIMNSDQYVEYHGKLAQLHRPNTVNIGVAPHSLRAADVTDIKQLTTELQQLSHWHIHIAEQLPEVEQCLAHTGLRPVEYLHQHIDVNEHWTLIHATHLQQNEVELISQSKAVIGICPTTEASLGDGIINQAVFDDSRKISWAIGSDSHISVSSIEELRWLEYTQRLLSHHRAVITDEQSTSNGQALWQAAVTGGARAIGHGGAIELGNQADWLTLDRHHPSLVSLPEKYLFDAVIFSNRDNSAIKDVYINGQRVIESGYHADEQQIHAQYQQLMQRLLSDL